MEPIWLSSYPPAVPARIGELHHASLADLLEDTVDRFARRPAFASLGQVLDYARVEEMSRCFAAFLTESLNLERGERVAIMLPNILQQPIAFWGAIRAGMAVVNTNPLYTARELEHQLRDSGATVLVVLEHFSDVVDVVLPRIPLKAVILTRLGDLLSFPRSHLANWYARLGHRHRSIHPIPGVLPFLQVLEEGSRLRFTRPVLGPDDTALIQYTGGTTGIAKGAILSHGNLLANVEQCTAWIRGGLAGGRTLLDGEETMLTALPLYHIFALTVDLLCFTRLGGLNHLIANPRDLPRLVRELRSVRFTAITGLNTLFKGLLSTEGFGSLDFSGLKFVIGGGMHTEEFVARSWRETTGVPITEGYGLTEASPVVTINPPASAEFTGSIGLPLPSTECSIRDDSGHPAPVGTAGELWVRGPQVMQGYRNRPEETAGVLTPDGWLRTGDIARMDERGYLYIVDRRKDMILVSGFNVYPNEIEAVLSTHPAVRECAAVGVPDDRTGEAVKVFVVLQMAELDGDGVRLYCRTHLAAYKVPKHVEFLDELPKTAIGKVLRRELRDGKA